MSEQKWVKPVRFAPKGHKFFMQDGGVCVADDSGDTPDQTDDGPLWVDVTRPASVGTYVRLPRVSLPVTKPGDDHEYYVGVTVECLRGLLAVLPLQVIFREGVQSMFDALRAIDRLRARPSLGSLLKVVGVFGGETLYEWAAPPAPPAPDSESYWLTEPLAKQVLGVSSQTLEDWRCKGRIKYRFDFDGAPEYKLSAALPTPGVAQEAGPRGSVGPRPPAVERAAPAAPPAPDSKPVWLSKRLAMEVLGVSGQTLYDWRRKGRIKYVFNKATRTYEYEVSTAPKRYSRK